MGRIQADEAENKVTSRDRRVTPKVHTETAAGLAEIEIHLTNAKQNCHKWLLNLIINVIQFYGNFR